MKHPIWLLPDSIDDVLGALAERTEDLRRGMIDLYRERGYALAMPALLESRDSLLVGPGVALSDLTFSLADPLDDRPLGLRADITPQIARIDAHRLHRDGPVRLCYAGEVAHARPRSWLASRCPLQVGAELFGVPSLDADLEVLDLMLESLRRAGIDGACLALGHSRIVGELLGDARLDDERRERLHDALRHKSKDGMDSALDFCGLRESALAESLHALVALHGDVDVLERAGDALNGMSAAIASALSELRAAATALSRDWPETALYFDLADAPGYRYHTGLVFAAHWPGIGRAIANGGRYDGIGAAFGRHRPATGFSGDLKTWAELAASQQGES